MASSINASTSGAGGVITTADSSGILNLQSGGNTIATVQSTGFSLPASATINAANTFGFKNRIINGGMTIDQRNAGASTTPSSGGYLLDRFFYTGTQASKMGFQQNYGAVTLPTGFSNYLGMFTITPVSVGAGDTFLVAQNIEGFNTADLGFGTANAKTVTLSFQVYSSLTGTFGGALSNSGANRSYPFSYSVPTANTWTTISITIAGDTSGTWIGATNGVGLVVRFGLGSGSTFSGTSGAWATGNYVQPTSTVSVVGTSGATFFITGVQLEVGSQATSFDFRDYGRELILCQRYYETAYNTGFLPSSTNSLEYAGGCYMIAIDTTTMLGSQYFKVWKRTSPTMTIYSYNGTAGKVSNVQNSNTVGAGTIVISRYNQMNFGLAGDSGSGLTAGTWYWFGWTASAEL